MTFVPIAPGTSRLTLLPLRLYRFSVPAPRHVTAEDGVDEDLVASVRQLVDNLRAVPVVEGYVVAIPMFSTASGAAVSSGPNMDEVIVAGTDGYGQIRTPVTPWFTAEDDVLFHSGGEYRIFWTYHRSVLQDVMNDLLSVGPTDSILDRYQFRTYVLEPQDLFGGEPSFRLLAHPRQVPPELRALFAALSPDAMGYVRVDASGERHRIHPHEPVLAILDRSGPLIALYAAELAQLSAAATVSQAIEDQSRLRHMEQMIAVTEAGKWPPDVEPTLDTFRDDHRAILDGYRAYSLACARNPLVDRRLFVDSLQVALLANGWLEAARAIRSLGVDHDHPYFARRRTAPTEEQARHDVLLGDPYSTAFEFYFDYYRLALREREHHYLRALERATRAQDSALQAVHRWIVEIAERHLSYPSFLLDLHWHLPEDRAPRVRLMDRYAALCAGIRFRFWEGMTTAIDTHTRLTTYLGWMASGGGGVAEVMGSLWEWHLGTYNLTAPQVERLLSETFATYAAATGTARRPIGGGRITLVVDFDQSLIRVEGAPLMRSGLSEFRFTREVEAPPVTSGHAPRSSTTRTVARASAPEPRRFTYEVPVGLEDTHWAPRSLEILSQTLNIGLAIARLSDELHRDDISTWITLTTNTLQLAGNAGTVIGALFRASRSAWLHRMVSAAGTAGTVAGFVDGGMMMLEGATILCSPSGGVSVALQRHDPVEADWMRARGTFLILGGGAGLLAETLALSGTAAVAAAAAPVGIAAGAIGLIVLGVDMALYVHSGGTSQLADFDDAFLGAKRDEFYRGEAPASDDAEVHSRTAARLWTLHHALRTLGG